MRRDAGFTLIEMVITLAVLAVICAVAAPRFITPTTVRPYYAVRKMRTDVRYAQLLAMEQQVPKISNPPRICITFDAANNLYALRRETAVGSNVWTYLSHPARVPNTISPATPNSFEFVVKFNSPTYRRAYQGAVISAVSLGNAAPSVIFDNAGSPFRSTGVGANVCKGGPVALADGSYVEINSHARLTFRAQTGEVDIVNV